MTITFEFVNLSFSRKIVGEVGWWGHIGPTTTCLHMVQSPTCLMGRLFSFLPLSPLFSNSNLIPLITSFLPKLKLCSVSLC